LESSMMLNASFGPDVILDSGRKTILMKTSWPASRNLRGDYSLLQAEPSLLLQNDNRFTDAFGSASSGRKFAITEHSVTKQKRMALVPPETKEKDLICVIYGLEVPFVLRRLNKPTTGNCFQLVGECYVHGIMDGEALNDGSEQEILLL
jgi:hypothetical protein